MGNKHHYHAATKGLEADLLFASRQQFIAGMNRVALCTLTNPSVIVIAFVLMDNHVHFILHGTYEDCMAFMAQYKRLTEIWLGNYAPDRKDKIWEYDCWMIPNREVLAEKICYVLRNPLVAGMGFLPTSYLWGSGPLMFSGGNRQTTEDDIVRTQYGPMRPVGDMTIYKQRKKFSTKIQIPKDWLVSDEGLIYPGSYVNWKVAEQAFGNIYNFMYEISKKNEDKINQEMYGADISLPDVDMLQILSATAQNSLGDANLSLLTVSQRLDLCREVRRSHGADLKQLGRLLHIKPQDLKKIW